MSYASEQHERYWAKVKNDEYLRSFGIGRTRKSSRPKTPMIPGGGCLVLMLRLALVLVLGVYLMILTGQLTDAQTPQPTMYPVGQYGDANWGYAVQWFETEHDECYVTTRRASYAGVGISCLRKTLALP